MTDFSAIRTVAMVFGGVGLFLLGMKVMSEGLQVVAGDRMRTVLHRMTASNLTGVFTGFLITALVQSSSATTVMVLSFVNAELITLSNSLGVIFGANIGTTVTAWIVAGLGIKIDIITFALPAIGLGVLLELTSKGVLSRWSNVVVGFGLLFLGLSFLKQALPSSAVAPGMHTWISQYCTASGWGTLYALLIGTAGTAIVQSSSATTSVVLLMAYSGFIDLKTAMVLFLGANIGTTVTALLASIGTNVNTRRASLAHLLFNVGGSLWVMLLIGPMETAVDYLWPGSPLQSKSSLMFHLTMFHTFFNLANTMLFLPFVGPFSRFLCRVDPSKASISTDKRLVFIGAPSLEIPSLSIAEARQELARMLSIVKKMFELATGTIKDGTANTPSVAQNVDEYEQVVDILQKEIIQFLCRVSRGKVTLAMASEIGGLIKAASDIERIGDHCELLIRLNTKLRAMKKEFNADAAHEIIAIIETVRRFLCLVERNMEKQTDNDFMGRSRELESSINSLRDIMRENNIVRLNNGNCGIETGLIFTDMVISFEKIGDHTYNVAEILQEKYKVIPLQKKPIA